MVGPRENAATYFVTSCTYQKIGLFQTSLMAELFIETLLHYRPQEYCLHEFVLMPDHFQILLTATSTLERAVQLIEGGSSFRAGKSG